MVLGTTNLLAVRLTSSRKRRTTASDYCHAAHEHAHEADHHALAARPPAHRRSKGCSSFITADMRDDGLDLGSTPVVPIA